jgi:hypothetical protein
MCVQLSQVHSRFHFVIVGFGISALRSTCASLQYLRIQTGAIQVAGFLGWAICSVPAVPEAARVE